MKVLIDACVLYPTVMREVVMGAAKAGLFTPLWSPRILEEWARAAAKLGEGQEVVARGEIAALNARWPKASVRPHDRDLRRLYLPDENDIHVLAAAIAGGADVLLTMNNKDFPRHMLAEECVLRDSPDLFLRALFDRHPEEIRAVVERVRAEAERLSGQDWPLRKLMKKARLPRLGKALEGAG
ncbi:RSP_2648 family PIN domain-containing protein [Aliiroseovarius subalbicans]|uniref:RSP_2648 family PIN domain-containing protein n=1 Tax=Aliiroseovarius subalbicans TaxID=2925840 RepID=UPI001F575D9A|nr:PIN domain-containing protein [uncultured Aliiroseovarius sp.]MCI2398224.1 PIN domain-containing protein [Aliiroseovarius subalbicans]